MRKTCCFILMLLISLILWAQDYKAKNDGQYRFGYIDDTGEWVIPPQFDYANDFSNNLGLVTIEGKHGAIDAKGKFIIPCEWDYVNPYYIKEGLVIVERDNRYGLLNVNGKVLISCEWSAINCTNSEQDSIVVEKDNLSGAFNRKGELILPCMFDAGLRINHWGHYKASIRKRVGLYDGAGKELVPCKYDDTAFFPDENGFTEVILGGKKGLCDMRGREVVPCKYSLIAQTLDKKYLCELNGKVEYYDLTGKRVPDPDGLTKGAIDEEGVKLAGSWSFSLNNSSKITALTGGKIENKSSTHASGNLKLCLFLTTGKYSGGDISGYVAFQDRFNPLDSGYNYSNINKSCSFVSIPDGTYYATLCLLEENGGYSIVDYLVFDEMISIDNSAERLQKVIDALNQTTNTLNALSNPVNPSMPSPRPGMSSPSHGSTRRKVREDCSFCHGSGKSPGKEHPPSYGLGRTYDNPPCDICGDRDNHYHRKCPSCGGKGYVEKYK